MAWAEEDVQEAVESAIEKFRAAGANVEHVNLPAGFPQAEAIAKRLMAAEAAAVHAQEFAAHRGQFGRHIAALVEEGQRLDAGELPTAREQQRRFAAEIGSIFAAAEKQPPLILAMPTTPTPAPPRLDTTGDARFNIPWTFAGLPAVTIPCGLSADGMPIGMQLVGPRDADIELLAAAAWWRAHPELYRQPAARLTRSQRRRCCKRSIRRRRRLRVKR